MNKNDENVDQCLIALFPRSSLFIYSSSENVSFLLTFSSLFCGTVSLSVIFSFDFCTLSSLLGLTTPSS